MNVAYLLALHRINGLGPIRLKQLVDYFKDPKLAWSANTREWENINLPQPVINLWQSEKLKIEPEEYAKKIFNSGIKTVTLFDADYPALLKEIYDPPVIVYYKGEVPKGRSIAVVGTRKVTGYGKIVTEKFASALAKFGFVIVSGLARGVDTLSHKSALAVDGKTIAVLGGGLDNIFPSENAQLAEKIHSGFGSVISELPPDYPALPGNFPARNRIISGLSSAVLVTEAAQDSGSLITAREALDQGREVFAIPGPITSATSKGTSLLIKQGATLVTEPEEILEELGIEKVSSSNLQVSDNFQLSNEEQSILKALENEVKHLDEICRQLSLATPLVSASLIKMEIKGLVKNLGGGLYTKNL